MLVTITGGISEKMKAKTYLDDRLKKICEDFESRYPSNKKVISKNI